MADYSNAMQVQERGSGGFVTIPAIGATPLSGPQVPNRVLVQTAGEMAVQLEDGSDNETALVTVTEGAVYDMRVTRYVTGNTCVLLGLL